MQVPSNDGDIRGFDISFAANANTGDVVKLSKFNAIRRSIKNILLMNTLDKPFHEELASGVKGVLFEIRDASDLGVLRTRIENTLERLEPRIKVQKVTLRPQLTRNTVVVDITYVIKKTKEVDNMTTTLKTVQ